MIGFDGRGNWRAPRRPFPCPRMRSLASFVFTRDLARADEATSRLQAGMVGINSLYVAQAETPFGGVKDSGDGRESGLEGLDSYLVSKFVSQSYL